MNTSNGVLTNRALPQSFSYVVSAKQADRALDLIDLSQLQFNPKSASEIELQKAKITEMVLAMALKVAKISNEEDLRILRLDPKDLNLTKYPNESGFKLINAAAIREGQGASAELITVLFVRKADSRDILLPLVFAHTNNQNIGWNIKEAIDNWCTEQYGDVADNLAEKPRIGKVRAFFEALGLLENSEEIEREKLKAQMRQQQAKEAKEKELADWKNAAQARLAFIRATLASIEATPHSDSKSWLLSQIQLQHYDTLLDAIITPHSDSYHAASLLYMLTEKEMNIVRDPKMITRTEGPRKQEREEINMRWSSARVSVPKHYVQTALSTNTDEEVRSLLTKALAKLAIGVKTDSWG